MPLVEENRRALNYFLSSHGRWLLCLHTPWLISKLYRVPLIDHVTCSNQSPEAIPPVVAEQLEQLEIVESPTAETVSASHGDVFGDLEKNSVANVEPQPSIVSAPCIPWGCIRWTGNDCSVVFVFPASASRCHLSRCLFCVSNCTTTECRPELLSASAAHAYPDLRDPQVDLSERTNKYRNYFRHGRGELDERNWAFFILLVVAIVLGFTVSLSP